MLYWLSLVLVLECFQLKIPLQEIERLQRNFTRHWLKTNYEQPTFLLTIYSIIPYRTYANVRLVFRKTMSAIARDVLAVGSWNIWKPTSQYIWKMRVIMNCVNAIWNWHTCWILYRIYCDASLIRSTTKREK